jgi:hypothetical protein
MHRLAVDRRTGQLRAAQLAGRLRNAVPRASAPTERPAPRSGQSTARAERGPSRRISVVGAGQRGCLVRTTTCSGSRQRGSLNCPGFRGGACARGDASRGTAALRVQARCLMAFGIARQAKAAMVARPLRDRWLRSAGAEWHALQGASVGPARSVSSADTFDRGVVAVLDPLRGGDGGRPQPTCGGEGVARPGAAGRRYRPPS